MIDLLTIFKIPDEWNKTNKFNHLRNSNSMISSGCYVLLSDVGCCVAGIQQELQPAAAGKNAAVLSLVKDVSEIEVKTPIGLRVKTSCNGWKRQSIRK